MIFLGSRNVYKHFMMFTKFYALNEVISDFAGLLTYVSDFMISKFDFSDFR